MLTISTTTPKRVRKDLAVWFRQQRIVHRMTQEDLSRRAGVALSTLRLFERSGQISLERLLRLALVLGSLDQFAGLCRSSDRLESISDIGQMEKKRVRASKASK